MNLWISKIINVESYKLYTQRDSFEKDKIMENMIIYKQEKALEK